MPTFKSAFDVESALLMYADDFAFLPASSIYEKDVLQSVEFATKKCHIYMIGYLPTIEIHNVRQIENNLVLKVCVAGDGAEIALQMPDGARLVSGANGEWAITDASGKNIQPHIEALQHALKHQITHMNFDVQYIGQAYGKDGSRTAIDRLLKHETLQRIALKGAPIGHHIFLMLIGIHQGNDLAFMFNPSAKDQSQGETRIDVAVNKLLSTTEAEQVTLFEASLIRYFQPKFNIEFKNSFPSSNLKALEECYKADLAAVCAEINFDNLPFGFKSDHAGQIDTVLAYFDLQDDEDRTFFFFDRTPTEPS